LRPFLFDASNGPRFFDRSRPACPNVARQLGKEGLVFLRVTIDERGRANEVEPLLGAGSGFDGEAVLAVRSSTYIPATRDGRPVTCKAILPVRFVLKDHRIESESFRREVKAQKGNAKS